jgi:hypothetical protein
MNLKPSLREATKQVNLAAGPQEPAAKKWQHKEFLKVGSKGGLKRGG